MKVVIPIYGKALQLHLFFVFSRKYLYKSTIKSVTQRSQRRRKDHKDMLFNFAYFASSLRTLRYNHSKFIFIAAAAAKGTNVKLNTNKPDNNNKC